MMDKEEAKVSDLPVTGLTTYALPAVYAGDDFGKLEQVLAHRVAEAPSDDMMAAVRQLLLGMGEDPDREGLLDTPKRVARTLREVTHAQQQHAHPGAAGRISP